MNDLPVEAIAYLTFLHGIRAISTSAARSNPLVTPDQTFRPCLPLLLQFSGVLHDLSRGSWNEL